MLIFFMLLGTRRGHEDKEEKPYPKLSRERKNDLIYKKLQLR